MWYRAEGLWNYDLNAAVPGASLKFTPPPFAYVLSVEPATATATSSSTSSSSSSKKLTSGNKEARSKAKAEKSQQERKASIRALAARDEKIRSDKKAREEGRETQQDKEEKEKEGGGPRVQRRYITPAPWEDVVSTNK